MRLFQMIAVCLIFLYGCPVAVRAQLAQEFKPPKANCCLPFQAQNLADQLQDWNQLGRYYEDNLRIRALPTDPARIVFMGDSITDMWKLEKHFSGKSYINRGISGQTTPQMLVRMYPDVINLKPAAIVILAGTNDIARNTGAETLEMIQDNFRAMVELAKGHSINVVLCSVTPVSDYALRKQTDQRPPAEIRRLNDWLKKFAEQINAQFVDYYSAVVDDKGFLKEEYSMDGLHPNEKGYDLMAPLVQAAIERALK